MNTTITNGSNKFEVTKGNTGVAVYIGFMQQTYTADLDQYDEIMDTLEDQPTLSEIVREGAQDAVECLEGEVFTAEVIDRVYTLNRLMNNYTWGDHNDYANDDCMEACSILEQYFENLVEELNLN